MFDLDSYMKAQETLARLFKTRKEELLEFNAESEPNLENEPINRRYVDMLDNYQKQLLYKMKYSLDEIDTVIKKLKDDGESEKDILRVLRHWIGQKEDGIK